MASFYRIGDKLCELVIKNKKSGDADLVARLKKKKGEKEKEFLDRIEKFLESGDLLHDNNVYSKGLEGLKPVPVCCPNNGDLDLFDRNTHRQLP